MKAYLVVSGTIFGLGAAAHFARLIYGWPIELAGWSAPRWVSWPGLLVAASLSVWAFSRAVRNGRPG